jgi:FkbM family methyltransferase
MKQRLRQVIQALLERVGLRLLYISNCPRGTAPANYRDILAKLPADLSKTAMLDVGANFGVVTSELLQIFPVDVHAFEPSPAVFEELQKKHSTNQRVHCHRKAISDTQGELPFEARPDDPFLGRLADASSSRGTINVEVTTVDAFLQAAGIDFVPLMKTDTEGFEIPVLKGAQSSLASGKIKSLLIEVTFTLTTHRHVTLSDVSDLLRVHGYKLFGLYDHHYLKSGQSRYCNALFKHESVFS